jgi:hypothetical protein
MNRTVRKLAREAVIFMLLAGVFGAVWLMAMDSGHPGVGELMLMAGIGFVFGLGVGLVAWALFSMVRFAIKG